MSTVLDRPTPDGRAASRASLELDLREPDFATRRRRPLAALTGVPTGDVYWLRHEMEARLDQRFCWSPAGDSAGPAVHTVVHLCPSEAAARSS